MTTRRWLLALATLFVVLALVVFGWLGAAVVEQRNSQLNEALNAQKLLVAPIVENARIFAGLYFAEVQDSLNQAPEARFSGQETTKAWADWYEYRFETPSLSGQVVGPGTSGSDPEFARFRKVAHWLFDRNQNYLGNWWSSQVDRTYFIARDARHAVSVPAWNLNAAVYNAPDGTLAGALAGRAKAIVEDFPGNLQKGTKQQYFTRAWIDPKDLRARFTILSPMFDLQGVWLGNAAVDYGLSELDGILASSRLTQAEWLLIDEQDSVLARAVSAGGDFHSLQLGQALASSRVALPSAPDGTQAESGGSTLRVSQVPGSKLRLYALVPTGWLYHDLPLVIEAGLAVIVLLILAFTLIGWLQRRNERTGLLVSTEAQAQVEQEHRLRDQEAAVKDVLAVVSNRLHQLTTRQEFAQTVLQAASEHGGAAYGAFYALEGDKSLVALGALSVGLDSLKPCRLGEGLVGECAKTQKALAIRGQEAEEFRVRWGQGPLALVAVDVLPLIQTGTLLGVVVLGHLQQPSSLASAFCEALLPVAALNLEILNRNVATLAQAKALERQQSILKETEAWSQGIIESSPDGLLVVDFRGTILMTNRQSEAIFGYEPGELIGQAIELLVPSAVRPRHGAMREGFVNSENQRARMGSGRDLHAVRKDGSQLRVEVGLSKLPALADSGTCVCAWVKPVLSL